MKPCYNKSYIYIYIYIFFFFSILYYNKYTNNNYFCKKENIHCQYGVIPQKRKRQ